MLKMRVKELILTLFFFPSFAYANNITLTRKEYEEIMRIMKETQESQDREWVLSSTFEILVMQTGFALLESGFIQTKNMANLMLKNLGDVSFGLIAMFCVGYGLEFGDKGNGFMGLSNMLGMGDIAFDHFLMAAAFCATCTTIVSGGVAERVAYIPYCIYSFVVCAFIFPIAGHWVWDKNGWLSGNNPSQTLLVYGVVDYAGDGPVHLLGGSLTLVCILIIGSRAGRFEDNDWKWEKSKPFNIILGVFFLWWGWFSFNSGSTGGLSGGRDLIAARISFVTALGAGGLVAGTFLSWLSNGQFDVRFMGLGVLGGLVGITASCAVVDGWESLVIGIVGATLACKGEKVLHHFKIDDPVGAVPTHMFAGFWGLIAPGLFAKKSYMKEIFPLRKEFWESSDNGYGLFHGGRWELLGFQILFAILIVAWGMILGGLLCFILKKYVGMRVSSKAEILGLDCSEHGTLLAEISNVYLKSPQVSSERASRLFNLYDSHKKKVRRGEQLKNAIWNKVHFRWKVDHKNENSQMPTTGITVEQPIDNKVVFTKRNEVQNVTSNVKLPASQCEMKMRDLIATNSKLPTTEEALNESSFSSTRSSIVLPRFHDKLEPLSVIEPNTSNESLEIVFAENRSQTQQNN